jgi:hypothetical protein
MRKNSTLSKIITKVDTSRGAPMGRPNVDNRTLRYDKNLKLKRAAKIFDCAVPMPDGCYDAGGAYWGHGAQLRVSYTKDLSYIEFYRVGDNR